jgi:integrase
MKLIKLTANQVARAGPGRHGDGGGLALIVSTATDGSLNKKFIFRFTWHGKPTECGMGGRGTTLAEARAKATEARRMVRAGINPVEAKRADKRHVATPTFGKCALDLIRSKESSWRSDVHRRQWRESVETHAAPIWDLPVDAIDTAAVLGVLQPVWQATPETASRVRGRIEAVLDYAKAHSFRSGENPAAWRGHLKLILPPARTQLSRSHYAAMDYRELPAFIAAISHDSTMRAMALEFLILTAARWGEVRGARWSEIDMTAKIWTIPSKRMKSGREHRVPVSGRAVEILEKLAETRWSDLVFPGRHGPLSRSAVAELVPKGATLHGFRSSFRDWAGEETNFPRELAEAALAHTTGDATERAYRRGDALEKRRALMDTWAGYCAEKSVDNVVHMRRQAAADDR